MPITIDAGNLPRFMQCNGHVLLPADPANFERDNTIREEGNAAHWLASAVFNGQHTIEEMIDRKATNGVYITAEMAEHVHDYLSCTDRAHDQISLMEWPYSIDGENWQINGRSDHIGYVDGILSIDDLKYGYSIVEPEENWTLISHAIGYCIKNGVQPECIVFNIHQPRAPHRDGRVRPWEISYSQLVEYYNRLAQTLANPSNMLQTGPHCYKCPSFIGCVARQDADYSAIEVSRNAFSADIDNDDLSARLDEIKRASDMLKQAEKAYLELGTFRAKQGQVIKNYMLENDQTNTTWIEGVTCDSLMMLTGKDVSKKSLPTPKQAKEAGIPEEVVTALTTRYMKGFKLVRTDASKKAKKLFGNKK